MRNVGTGSDNIDVLTQLLCPHKPPHYVPDKAVGSLMKRRWNLTAISSSEGGEFLIISAVSTNKIGVCR